MFHKLRRAYKSIPAVGSSSITNLDCPHKAIATLSFRLLPPDKFLPKVFLKSQIPTSFNNFSTSAIFSFLEPIAPLNS
jgi:hypothetical protein